ncbi:cyclin-dependent kinase inhibitor 1 isoform X2 [Engraulis encrasicolus]|uniref:cyclin-dependent kinase inhibitor 1 isoform X2 n=1 Tax=Engraulis encrasicolus TaxID=184585 RepID=UPI002FD5C812
MCKTMAFHKRIILRSLGNGQAKRNLFGPVDREQLQQDYHLALRQDLEEASRRWGFNFLTEKPLEDGDFLWEGISGSKVPLVYRSSTLRNKHLGSSNNHLGPSSSSNGGSASFSSSSRSSGAGGVSTEMRAAGGATPGPSLQSGGKENVRRTPERKMSSLRDLERTPEKRSAKNNSLKRKQTNITDFYQAKRRVVGTPRKSGQ